MSFVFSSLGCRLTAACISALMLSGCSGSDRVPFADVGGPRAGDPLIGKVDQTRDGRVLIGRVGDPQAEAAAYAPPTSPANGGSAGIDYLDTPDPSQSDGVQTAPMMAAAEPRSMAGGQEPSHWIDQSFRYAHHLAANGIGPGVRVSPGYHHFDIMNQYQDPDSDVMRAILRLARR